MALPTPRRLARPSLGSQNVNTASSPNLNINQITAMARKASLNALTGQVQPSTPAGRTLGGDGRDIEVGDAVDVPGGMFGTVKFIGTVNGKKGTFAGVELAGQFAPRGKNDGDADGVRYFTTSVPGSGIFLPLHRASRRGSPASSDGLPATPTTPSLNFSMSTTDAKQDSHTPNPAVMKFSQSVGPGARATSPIFRPKVRPSLPRPESPSRRNPVLPAAKTPSQGQPLLKSAAMTPRMTPSPGPGKFGGKQSRTPGPPRPYSRSNSRVGQHAAIDEDSEITPVGLARTSDGSSSNFVRYMRPLSNQNETETHRLTRQLEERDRQLKEQAASLSEMEASLAELQTLLPADASEPTPRPSRGPFDDNDAAQLRAILREKNEKISLLSAEFDAHRADFRSTIDTLEMASTEAERVYEKRIDDLMLEIRNYQDRSEDVESVAEQLKKMEEVVQELEDGLEEARRGEAEARGEVEFLRGEVERGRAELRREREKAAAALKGAGAAIDGSSATKGLREVEQRDDEIRGLKAIIHSLSSGPDRNSATESIMSPLSRTSSLPKQDTEELTRLKSSLERSEREKDELRGLIDRKSFREDELERELDRLRSGPRARDPRNSSGTVKQDKRSSGRDSRDTVVGWRGGATGAAGVAGAAASTTGVGHAPLRHDTPLLEHLHESDAVSSADGSVLWCELCDSAGHNVLDCTNAFGSSKLDDGVGDDVNGGDSHHRRGSNKRMGIHISGDDPDTLGLPPKGLGVMAEATQPAPLNTSRKGSVTPLPPQPQQQPQQQQQATGLVPNPHDSGLVGAKGTGEIDASKWCALCERDGHDSVSCPFEDAF